MKNKKVTYFLIVGVIAVWGVIFYRIFDAMGEQETDLPQTVSKKENYFKEVNHQNDAVTLLMNYPDPFDDDGNQQIEAVANDRPKTATVIPMTIARPIVNWSGILYNGYIFNPTTKQKVAILMVNGKELLLAEGQSANGVKLIKYAGDSVKVGYQNEVKFIRIK